MYIFIIALFNMSILMYMYLLLATLKALLIVDFADS